MGDQSPSKETLERQKLGLEIQVLQAKVGLEEERAKLDVKNLRWTFRRTLMIAVLSASVPMAIAVVGWLFQNFQARRSASLTEQYRREELYNKMIENIGNASPSSRLAAVSGLSEYALPDGRIGERQTSAEVINALTHRLASEEDAGVQQRILVAIGSVGKAALPHLANANRYAAGQFVQHSGELAGLLVQKRAPSGSDYGYAEIKKIESVDLPEEVIPISLVLELAAPKEQPGKNEKSSDNKSDSSSGLMHLSGLYNLSGQHRQTFLSYIRLAKSAKPEQIDVAISAARADFRRSARFLLATNIALEQVLRASSGNLRGENLDGIVIIWANLTKLDLAGLSFRNTFLRADVHEADLSFCDFSGSRLIDLRVKGTKFRGATLTTAIVPAEFDWMRVEDGPDLTGANWWDAFELDNDGESRDIDPDPRNSGNDPRTFNFIRSFPKATQSEVRKMLLAGSTNQK